MFRRRFLQTGIILVPSVLALSAAVYAATTYTQSRPFPPVTVAAGETAQINVANVASASAGGTAASCTGTITFYNSSGGVIGAATSFTVVSNASSSYSITSVTREVVLGVVTLTESSSSAAPCALESSLEISSGTNAPRLVLRAGGPGGPGPDGPGRLGPPGGR